jgi:hypothetical protein
MPSGFVEFGTPDDTQIFRFKGLYFGFVKTAICLTNMPPTRLVGWRFGVPPRWQLPGKAGGCLIRRQASRRSRRDAAAGETAHTNETFVPFAPLNRFAVASDPELDALSEFPE